VHAGGITEAKKILAAGEAHGQRSALHHASSPVNGTACLHVDAAVPNFGIQEWMELEPLHELFPNAPRAHDGYVTPPAGPGLGLELDEAAARRRPSRDARLPQRYWPDGSVGDY
jgi:mannonate dehydratase